jgi:hypothetical protein
MPFVQGNVSGVSSFVFAFLFSICCLPLALAQKAKRPFTVTDEIGLTLFGSLDGGAPEMRFSPDGKYFAVWS